MWQEMTSHLSKFDQTGRERKRKKKKKKKKIRERLLLLSRFPSDQTFDSGRSKRQSWSTHRELCVDTKNNGFHQTSRCRGSSPTRFIFDLRAIQMAPGRGREWPCISVPNLGLNAEFLGLFLGSLGIDLRTVIGSCVLFLHVVAKKMNSILVACKLCYYMST